MTYIKILYIASLTRVCYNYRPFSNVIKTLTISGFKTNQSIILKWVTYFSAYYNLSLCWSGCTTEGSQCPQRLESQLRRVGCTGCMVLRHTLFPWRWSTQVGKLWSSIQKSSFSAMFMFIETMTEIHSCWVSYAGCIGGGLCKVLLGMAGRRTVSFSSAVWLQGA